MSFFTRSNEVRRNKEKSLLPFFAVLIVTALLGRTATYFYNLTYNDITFADWIPALLSYLSEILVCLRTAFVFGALTYAAYCGVPVRKVLIPSLVIAFADYAARFFIDWHSGALASSYLPALMWLGAEFVYEAVFILIAAYISVRRHEKMSIAETVIMRKKYSPSKTNYVTVAVFTLSRMLSEVIYLVDFLTTYSDVTNTEVASIIGSFLKIAVIYGGVGYIAAELSFHFLSKRDQ